MKKYFLILISIIIVSCNSQPTCDKQEAYDLVLQSFKNEVKEQLENSYFYDNYNYSDISSYANDNGLDLKTLKEQKVDEIKQKAKEYADEILIKTTFLLENIRTTEISENIKKCNCVADVVVNSEKVETIKYSVQYTTDKKIYVEIY